MDSGSVQGQMGAVSFLPAQRQLITAIEQHVNSTASTPTCTIVAITKPAHPLNQLKDFSHYLPKEKASSTQAHIPAGILGGANPGRAIIMMDTGAGLTIITEKVCDVHGLKIRGPPASYLTASNEKAKLLGVADIIL